MYGVALDAAGNYVLIGGSGDEYTYSETDSVTGWKSDIWVSYLVILDTEVSQFLFYIDFFLKKIMTLILNRAINCMKMSMVIREPTMLGSI